MDFTLAIPSKMLIIDAAIIVVSILSIIWCLLYSKDKRTKYVALIINSGIIILFSFLLITATQTKVVVKEDYIKVNALPYSMEIINKEQIVRAFVEHLDDNNNLNPVYKTNGARVSSYKTGHYKLNNGNKAIVMLNSNKALYIELKDNRFIILAPDDFEGFIKAVDNKIINIQK
jgi:hypothetical protein